MKNTRIGSILADTGGVSMKKRRYALAAVCLSAVFGLSSCSGLNLGSEKLMEPPRLSKQQEEIRGALAATVGTEDFRFYTPRSGQNRTPVFYADLCGDSRFEAGVLYRLNAAPEETRICVLTRGTDTAWTQVCDFAPAEGSTVERVETARLGGTGYAQLVAGTTLYTGRESALSVWEVDTGKAVCVFNGSYGEMVTGDINGDSTDEMVLFNSLPEGGTAANLIGFTPETGIALQSTELLDIQITAYLQAVIGNTDTGSRAVFVDGATGPGVYATEVVALRNGQLVKTFGAACPTRDVPLVCRDINADGCPEVPVQEILPGYTNMPTSDRVLRVDWSSCGVAGLTVQAVSAVNQKWAYTLCIPRRLEGAVTVLSDGDDDLWTLCMWDADKQATSQKVLTVRAWIASEWEEEEALHPEQSVIAARGNVCFTVEFYRDDVVTAEELRTDVLLLL